MSGDLSFLNATIRAALTNLTGAYRSVAQLASQEDPDENKAVSSAVSFTYMLDKLRDNLVLFKREMREAMVRNYFPLRDSGRANQRNISLHIDDRIGQLRQAIDDLNAKIPDDELRRGLGIHYDFHCNLSLLSADLILQYFSTNYLMRLD